MLGGMISSGRNSLPCSGGSISDSTESDVAFAANLMRVVALTGNWLSSIRHVNVIVSDEVVDSFRTRMIRVSWASHNASAFARNRFLASLSSAGLAMFPFVGYTASGYGNAGCGTGLSCWSTFGQRSMR